MLLVPADTDSPPPLPSRTQPVLPGYSSESPSIGAWARNVQKEREKDEDYFAGAGDHDLAYDLDASLLLTGYVPSQSWDWRDNDGRSDETAELGDRYTHELGDGIRVGSFLTDPLPWPNDEVAATLAAVQSGGIPIPIHEYREVELSPLQLSPVVSSAFVSGEEDAGLSDVNSEGDVATEQGEDEGSTRRVESNILASPYSTSSPSTRNHQLSLTSSLTILKTPKQFPRLDASYLQTRLHELLEDNLLDFGLARTQKNMGIPMPIPTIDLETLGLNQSLGISQSHATPRGTPQQHQQRMGLRKSLSEHHGKAKKRPGVAGKRMNMSFADLAPRGGTLTPRPRIEAPPPIATSSPISENSTSTATPSPVTPVTPTRIRSGSRSESFISRIPRFSAKNRDSDGESESSVNGIDGGAGLLIDPSAVLQSAFSNITGLGLGMGVGAGAASSRTPLRRETSSAIGLILDPTALAERFMEEFQSCLVEIIARVFVQLLAELRVGGRGAGAMGRGGSAGALVDEDVDVTSLADGLEDLEVEV